MLKNFDLEFKREEKICNYNRNYAYPRSMGDNLRFICTACLLFARRPLELSGTYAVVALGTIWHLYLVSSILYDGIERQGRVHIFRRYCVLDEDSGIEFCGTLIWSGLAHCSSFLCTIEIWYTVRDWGMHLACSCTQKLWRSFWDCRGGTE